MSEVYEDILLLITDEDESIDSKYTEIYIRIFGISIYFREQLLVKHSFHYVMNVLTREYIKLTDVIEYLRGFSPTYLLIHAQPTKEKVDLKYITSSRITSLRLLG